MTNTESYQAGDTIEYETHMGGLRQVRVTAREDEAGNNYQPGFTGVDVSSGTDVWGYDRQIKRVVAWKDCPGFDELPVGACVDLTGVSRAEYRLAEGQTHADVAVTGFHEAASGRRYAQFIWQDEYFMAQLDEVDFYV